MIDTRLRGNNALGFWEDVSGELYETFVVGELYKWIASAQEKADLSFYRTRPGLEGKIELVESWKVASVIFRDPVNKMIGNNMTENKSRPARQQVFSGSPYENEIGFCRAIRVDNTIIVAGTAPIAPDGSTASPGDAYGQTRRCLEIIKEAIEGLGGTLEDVIRTRMMITDAGIWEDVGRAHGEFFSTIRPAATMVVVKGLVRDDWLVEIEADALAES